MTTKQKAYIALAGTSILWGTTWVASKIAVRSVPGLQVAAIRQFAGGIILVSFFLFKGEKFPAKSEWPWLLLMATLMFTASNGLATLSLKYVNSGLGALIGALYPLFVVLIERILYKNNRITSLTFLGLVLGIGGIAIVFYDSAFHSNANDLFRGLLCGLGAMISWSIATIIIARRKLKMNAYNATGWQMFLGSLMLICITLITGNSVPISAIPPSTWWSIFYLVTAGSVIAFAAFIYTMRHMEPAIAALYAYINPLVAIFTGMAIVGEKLTAVILAGSVITLIGVYLVNQSIKRAREL